MDEAEKKAYEVFSHRQGLLSEAPSYLAAFTASTADLAAGRSEARALFGETPDTAVPEEARARMSAERSLELTGVVGLLARALGKHPELNADCLARAPLLNRLNRLDQALGRSVWVGQLFEKGGDNGALLCGAALIALCQGVLKQGQQRQVAPDTTTEARGALALLLSEPLRALLQTEERKAREKDRNDRAEEPLRTSIQDAEASAAVAQLVEAYLASLRREP